MKGTLRKTTEKKERFKRSSKSLTAKFAAAAVCLTLCPVPTSLASGITQNSRAAPVQPSGNANVLENYQDYLDEQYKLFDIADTYPEYPEDWELPGDRSLDNDSIKFLGFSGKLSMGEGYGYGSDWIALEYKMATNSNGDNIFRDIDGKNIIGYCYGGDGLWAGHGDRSYNGGNYVTDEWGVPRLSNYLKTEVGEGSDKDTTGHRPSS